jgi:NAD(P)-dependent dehydrogenase (short-subunit alcohol dehydrogenase family)
MTAALIRMRFHAFLRSGMAFAPMVGAMVLIGLAYGGGAAMPGEAYGFTAIVMFPVLAWQTKIILDGEPDVQRRLARVAVGSAGRELAAGLVVAAIAGLGSTAVALALPWLIGGIRPPADGTLGVQVALGVWAHLLAIPPAVGLGALASRAITRHAGRGVLVLLSSVAAERARRSNFVYGSSKAGVDAFYTGLGDSLVGTGVSVLIVRPGFVKTKMTEGMQPAPLSTTADEVAEVIVRALESGAEEVWAPRPLRAVMSVLRHVPRPVFRRLPL